MVTIRAVGAHPRRPRLRRCRRRKLPAHSDPSSSYLHPVLPCLALLEVDHTGPVGRSVRLPSSDGYGMALWQRCTTEGFRSSLMLDEGVGQKRRREGHRCRGDVQAIMMNEIDS